MTRITSATAISSGFLDVADGLPDRNRAVHQNADINRRRYLSAQCRKFRQQGIDHRDGVGIRLLLMPSTMERSSFSQLAILSFSTLS